MRGKVILKKSRSLKRLLTLWANKPFHGQHYRLSSYIYLHLPDSLYILLRNRVNYTVTLIIFDLQRRFKHKLCDFKVSPLHLNDGNEQYCGEWFPQIDCSVHANNSMNSSGVFGVNRLSNHYLKHEWLR